MPAISELTRPLLEEQRYLADFPWTNVEADLDRIYGRGQIEIGFPPGVARIFPQAARNNSAAINGVMYGDEGKGRWVDNKIAGLLEAPGIQSVNAIRYQGGNNAGHTIEMENGKRVALHVIPSAIMYEKARGIIDQGVVVHVEDLRTEMGYAEGIVGNLKGRVLLSSHALLCTDLERAEEVANRVKSNGAANGGTARGIGPTYAHHYDRLGLKVEDLVKENWRTRLGDRYDRYQKEFASIGMDLATTKVPDFHSVKLEGKMASRTVGLKEEFLDRLEVSRQWLLSRNMTTDTLPLHREIFHDPSQGVLFEGAQGIGLNAWFGSYPDVTASDTSAWGILAGTGYWRPDNVKERIGILKGPYTSSVGKRRLPTQIHLAKDNNDLPSHATLVEERGVFIRNKARERGTTTGRWRDVSELDLANLSYNAVVAGVDVLAVTMMDVVRETDTIRVSTHHEKDGKPVPFRPGMEYMSCLTPVYVNLPGWDGEKCSQATSIAEFPIEAQQYLSFIQARTAVPIVAVTASPARNRLITLPGYKV